MAILPIVIGQDQPILRAKTKKVPKVTKEILSLIKDMKETTVAAKGAGIAAPQVNRSERVCICMLNRKLVALINPEIISKSETLAVAEEGCLSLPDIWLHVPRSVEILVKFLDVKGHEQELKLKDFNARVVQHEVDHLEGVLIVDYPHPKLTTPTL